MHGRAALQLCGRRDEVRGSRHSIDELEARYGDALAGLKLNLDGCPHACGHHWVGDLGFQGSTVRNDEGIRRQAYDILLRGGLGPDAAIARPVFRRVPDRGARPTPSPGFSTAGSEQRQDEHERFRAFCDRMTRRRARLSGRAPSRREAGERKRWHDRGT